MTTVSCAVANHPVVSADIVCHCDTLSDIACHCHSHAHPLIFQLEDWFLSIGQHRHSCHSSVHYHFHYHCYWHCHWDCYCHCHCHCHWNSDPWSTIGIVTHGRPLRWGQLGHAVAARAHCVVVHCTSILVLELWHGPCPQRKAGIRTRGHLRRSACLIRLQMTCLRSHTKVTGLHRCQSSYGPQRCWLLLLNMFSNVAGAARRGAGQARLFLLADHAQLRLGCLQQPAPLHIQHTGVALANCESYNCSRNSGWPTEP